MSEEHGERQTCPRRMGEFGPWKREEGLDFWERDRWHATAEAAERAREEFKRKYPNGSSYEVHWMYPGEMPRTCSFCGGIHPEDAMALLRHGWEIQTTDKWYKRYLEPPGSQKDSMAYMRWLSDGRFRSEEPPKSRYASPVPPVKLYVQHFTEEQRARFNELLARIANGEV